MTIEQLPLEVSKALAIADFVNAFKILPRFAELPEDEQTQAIVNFLTSIPPLANELIGVIENFGKIELVD